MHSTQFLLWNNFGAELEAADELSCTALGSKLLEWTGLEKPLYFLWVDQALEDMSLYRERLFVGADGTAYDQVPPESEETIALYRSIVYDFLYGENYISEAITQISKEKSVK